MATNPQRPLPPALLQEVLTGLASPEAKHREAMILRYGQGTANDERVNEILRHLAANDPQTYVREAASLTLTRKLSSSYITQQNKNTKSNRTVLTILVLTGVCACISLGVIAQLAGGANNLSTRNTQVEATAHWIETDNAQVAMMLTSTVAAERVATAAERSTSSTPGPSPTPLPTETAKPAATPTFKGFYVIGDTIHFRDWDYKVTNVEYTKVLQYSEFGNKVSAKGIFVIAYLTLKNVGKSNYTNNPFNWQLTDDAGIRYDTSDESATYSFLRFKNLVSLGDQFPPGLELNSAVIYDINPSAKGLKLHLNDVDTDVLLGR